MKKVGENLSFREDYLFWRLAHYLVSDREFRIIKLSNNQNEVWLEKFENKHLQLIRLFRHDLDWGNWLQKDMELAAANGERIRQRFTKRNINMLNVYVSMYPPVDDYEFRISKPFVEPNRNKTAVSTLIFDQYFSEEKLSNFNRIINGSFSITLKDEYDEGEVIAVKQATFAVANNRAKSEAELFQYGKPFFTYIFIAIQVIVFLLLEINGGSTNTSTLLRFGAKFNPLILEGEWWRFFTPIVLHIGFLHLAMNTLALYYLGTAVERIFGKFRFLFIYLVAGFFGSLASFVFSPSISAGASGAIFGCFGALLYFGVIYPRLFFRTMGMNIIVVIGINLVFGFTVPGIDNAGHLGGLVGGFLATGIVHFPKKRKLLLQIICFIIASTAVFALLQVGYQADTKSMDEPTTLVLAQQYIQTEQFEKAYDLLHEYMLNHEEEPSLEFYLSLAFAELRLGMFDDAKEHLLFIVDKNNDYAEAHYYLAIIYAEEEMLEQAVHHAQKAAQLRPDDVTFQELLNHFDNYLKGIGEEGLSLLSYLQK